MSLEQLRGVLQKINRVLWWPRVGVQVAALGHGGFLLWTLASRNFQVVTSGVVLPWGDAWAVEATVVTIVVAMMMVGWTLWSDLVGRVGPPGWTTRVVRFVSAGCVTSLVAHGWGEHVHPDPTNEVVVNFRFLKLVQPHTLEQQKAAFTAGWESTFQSSVAGWGVPTPRLQTHLESLASQVDAAFTVEFPKWAPLVELHARGAHLGQTHAIEFAHKLVQEDRATLADLKARMDTLNTSWTLGDMFWNTLGWIGQHPGTTVVVVVGVAAVVGGGLWLWSHKSQHAENLDQTRDLVAGLDTRVLRVQRLTEELADAQADAQGQQAVTAALAQKLQDEFILMEAQVAEWEDKLKEVAKRAGRRPGGAVESNELTTRFDRHAAAIQKLREDVGTLNQGYARLDRVAYGNGRGPNLTPPPGEKFDPGVKRISIWNSEGVLEVKDKIKDISARIDQVEEFIQKINP